MNWFKLHPKVLAAALTEVGLAASAFGAYFSGEASLNVALSLTLGGLSTTIAGYLKGA